jgi:hypothetical protein
MATAFGYLGWLSDEDNYEDYYNDYFEQYGYLNKYFPSSFFLTDNATLNNYKTKSRESYVLYEPLDLSEDDNKYCIYWYRWEKNYTPPENETFLPNGWRRMTADDGDFSSPHSADDSDGENIGLSALYYYDDDSDFKYTYKKTKTYKSSRKYYEKKENNKKITFERKTSITKN